MAIWVSLLDCPEVERANKLPTAGQASSATQRLEMNRNSRWKMKVNQQVECDIFDSQRVRLVAQRFGMKLEKKARERFEVEVPGLEEEWKIGAIVGPSGSGKTTVARAAFGEAMWEGKEWPEDRAVVDALGEVGAEEVTRALGAVGLNSPPAWVKPYGALSKGEQFRCDVARALLSGQELVVVDEFSSVVDRKAAQVGSAAVARAVREGKLGGRLVAVTCHYDVLPWLQADWVLDMAEGRLERRRLRRPAVRLRLFVARQRAWQQFRRHHYLDAKLNPFSVCYLAAIEEQPVAFAAVLPLAGKKGFRRISRLVVLPDYQGIGIGGHFLQAVAMHLTGMGFGVTLTTSHPAMLSALERSGRWKVQQRYRRGGNVQQGLRGAKCPAMPFGERPIKTAVFVPAANQEA